MWKSPLDLSDRWWTQGQSKSMALIGHHIMLHYVIPESLEVWDDLESVAE